MGCDASKCMEHEPQRGRVDVRRRPGRPVSSEPSIESEAQRSGLPSAQVKAAKALDEDLLNVMEDFGYDHDEAHLLKSLMEIINSRVIERDVRTDYEMITRLGGGANGEVYKMRNMKTGEFVAVKQLKDTTRFNMQAGDRKNKVYLRELGLLLNASHETLIGLKTVYKEGKQIWIVSELVDPHPAVQGPPDLMSYFEYRRDSNTPLSAIEVAILIYKVTTALAYLNDECLAMHRDLKPDNILVGKEGLEGLKVADYGHGRFLTNGSLPDKYTIGASNGTIGYQAPEMLTGQNYDTKVDIWSLGCIIYMSIMYKFPFGSKSARVPYAAQVKRYEQTGRLTIDSRVGEDCIRLIKRMLEVDPAQRFSAHEILEDPWLKATLGL